MSNFMVNQRAILTATSIIDGRTLHYSHKRLMQLLKTNMTVLDVGCGTGAITSGIADKVGSNGRALGIDNNKELIQKASEKYAHITNLSFKVEDLYHLSISDTFDIVSCSRVLQWINNPLFIIQQLRSVLNIEGKLVVLDYNHLKIEWSPEPPLVFLHFYNQFMKWREDAGMDNQIADNLEQLLTQAGFIDIRVTEHHELSTMSQFDFFHKANMWSAVMASRGTQMIQDGYLTDVELDLAQQAYLYWLHNHATSQKLYLLTVEGTKQ